MTAAADLVGYRPNSLARALRMHRTLSIGLVVPRLNAQNCFVGTAFLHDVLAEAGYRIMFCCHHDQAALEVEALRSLCDYHVDAMIHVSASPGGAEAVLGPGHGIPVVELYRRTTSSTADSVVSDGEVGAYELTRHLVELGHRRIGFVTGSDVKSTIRSRDIGFRRAIAETGLDASDCPVLRVTAGAAETVGPLMFDLLLRPPSRRPTALVAATSHISLHVLEALRTLQVSVPSDMSVAAFSNAEWSSICAPSLTTYEIPLEEMGRKVAELLWERLRPFGSRVEGTTNLSFEGQLCVRESTSSPHQPAVRS